MTDPGKLLSAEQSVRLAICDSVDRGKLIAEIVAHLQRTLSRTAYLKDGDSPAMLWRRMEI